jgi:acyl dehydratase
MDQITNPVTRRTIAQLQALEGSVVGVSPWFLVDQPRIDAFADVTEDHQYIHVDPAAAAASPFGGTIAHGFLSLSLLSRMAETGLAPIEGVTTIVNYGFDRVRFLTPVPSGAWIRGSFKLDKVTPRPGGQTLFQYTVEIEIQGGTRPALSASWLILTVSDSKENAA